MSHILVDFGRPFDIELFSPPGADADRVHWLGEPSQIFIATTLFLVLRLIITVYYCSF